MSSKIWLISDSHFYHSNIVRGSSNWTDKSGCRDFDTVEEHDQVILENLNNLVMPEDTLFHLGDFTVGSSSGSLKMRKSEAYIHFRDKIKCDNIIYIRGNHSLSKYELEQLDCFYQIEDYYELKYKKSFIIMSHYPFLSWNSMSHGSFMLHGHCHSKMIRGRSMDIGVDSNNFKPWLLDDVIEKLSKEPVLTEGHHK